MFKVATARQRPIVAAGSMLIAIVTVLTAVGAPSIAPSFGTTAAPSEAIVFISGNGRLATMSPTGNNVASTSLTTDDFSVNDGGQLAYVAAGSGEVLESATLSFSPSRVSAGSQIDTGTIPAVSPDGSRVAFSFQTPCPDLKRFRPTVSAGPGDDRESGIYVVNSDGTDAYSVYAPGACSGDPNGSGVRSISWSPDGHTLAFVGDGHLSGCPSGIYTVPASGGIPERLDLGGGAWQYFSVAWSSYGLAFTREPVLDSNCGSAGDADVFTASASGGSVVDVSNSNYSNETWAQWSPTGESLVVSDVAGNTSTLPASGGAESLLGPGNQPYWITLPTGPSNSPSATPTGMPSVTPSPTATSTPTPPTPSPPTPQLTARCDVYWARPGSTLVVPSTKGVLSNDTDPAGSGIRAHVSAISFGVHEHPYSLSPTTGALKFMPGSSTKDREAEINYYDTDAQGRTSNHALITLVVRASRPRHLSKYCTIPAHNGEASFANFLTSCTHSEVTAHHVFIHQGKVKGTLYWSSFEPGENLCFTPGAIRNTWVLKSAASATWEGTPSVPDEIAVTDQINVSGYDLHVDGSLLPAGVSIGLSAHMGVNKNTDARSREKHAGIDFSSPPVKAAATDSGHLTQTVSAWIALPGIDNDNLHLIGSFSANVCVPKDFDVQVGGIGACH